MILELAVLDLARSNNEEFEEAFVKAQKIIMSMPGYISHELHKCVKKDNRYLLQVKWNTLEDHTVGFRESSQYQEWRTLLHHFYDPFPVVEHYEEVPT